MIIQTIAERIGTSQPTSVYRQNIAKGWKFPRYLSIFPKPKLQAVEN